MDTYKKGFGVVEIIIVVVILGIVTALGWLLYQSTSNTDNSVADKTEKIVLAPEKQTKPENVYGYLNVPDSDVKIPLNEDLKLVELGAIQPSSYNENDKNIQILVPQLEKEWTCKINDTEQSKPSIGSISVTTNDIRSGPYEPVTTKKIGEYKYGFETSASGTTDCTDSPEYKKLVDAFKVQFENIKVSSE